MRTIGTWVLLIILFVSFYNFFSTPPGRESSSGWFLLLAFGAFVVFMGFSAFMGKRARKGLQLNTEGAVLLERGRVAAALEKFQEARPLLKDDGQGAIPFNIGLSQLYLWNLEAAGRELSKARGHKQLPEHVRRLIPERLALVAALRGDARAAQALIEETRTPEGEAGALILLTEGVLACRRAEWARARTLLDNPDTHVLGGPLRGLRDALLAWSVEQTTGERRYVDLVTVFGEASTDKLREAWPELVSFLLDRARQAA